MAELTAGPSACCAPEQQESCCEPDAKAGCCGGHGDGCGCAAGQPDIRETVRERYAAAAGVANARFVKGDVEDIPLPDDTVDVVISNCVSTSPATSRR